MIECIFTLDYEIYGNGEGSLRELVLEPTQRLMSVFKEWNSTFVVFAEALEFAKIREFKTDASIADVPIQLQQLHEGGFEIGLHLHPWWYNVRRENGRWKLDWSERNICASSAERVDEIVCFAVGYLREAIRESSFTPRSFRGGLWLMQPTKTMAEVLFRNGIQIDSSVFKGGRIRDVGVDYRPAARQGWYWRFADDVNEAEPGGPLLEVPIYTEMVPFWKMLGGKRLNLQKRVPAAASGEPLTNRYRDFARLRYPRKFDFCRMRYEELRSVIERVLEEDRKNPESYKPIVAIGHSKDLVDFDAVRRFLEYLAGENIGISTFKGVAQRLQPAHV